jgi:hypothetical protein
MAQIRAVATGNWSNTSTWLNGIKPTTADDVHPSSFVVTIDENITVLSLRTTQPTGGVLGGSFIIASPVAVNLPVASLMWHTERCRLGWMRCLIIRTP